MLNLSNYFNFEIRNPSRFGSLEHLRDGIFFPNLFMEFQANNVFHAMLLKPM